LKVLRGKKALVTGAAGGIGRSIALELARRGADLFLLDIQANRLENVREQADRIGVEALSRTCDLAQPKQITDAVKAVLEQWGKLDIIVNNAAVLYYGPVQCMDIEHWRHTLEVNLHAPIQLCCELLPTLLAQPEGHILNVCSMNALVAIRKLAPYQTSKFGLLGFTESLRADLRRTNVGATALCPGYTRTGFMHTARNVEPGRRLRPPPAWMFTTAEKVATKAVGAIRRNKALVIVTPIARLLWLAKRLSPRLVDFLQRHA